MVAFENRHACLLHDSLRFTLGAHLTDGASGWTYEGQVLTLKKLNEVGILRQEPISKQRIINKIVSNCMKVCGRHLPRVDGLRFSVLGDLDEVRYFKIRFSCWRWSHHEGLIHDLGVLGEFVGLRVHTNGFNSESMSGSSYAACDFTAISDQKLVKHFLSNWFVYLV